MYYGLEDKNSVPRVIETRNLEFILNSWKWEKTLKFVFPPKNNQSQI